MAGKGIRGLNEAMKVLNLSPHTCRSAASGSLIASSGFSSREQHVQQTNELHFPSLTRSMATEAHLPRITTSTRSSMSSEAWAPVSHVPVTIRQFPTLEPQSLEHWSTKHLYLPLRRDLLHLAVVFEGDGTRQGTASTKTRWDVHGSHRKLHPQKGSGRARVGTKQSPIRRGGGVAHGPHPRDFSTKLNRKVYDQAWRIALSYRYRRGELIVCEDGMELPLPDDFTILAEGGFMGKQMMEGYRRKWMGQVLDANSWGKDFGRTLFVTGDRRPRLFDTMAVTGEHGRCLEVNDVDVKDLLEEGRVVVERSALKEMIEQHQSDLVSKILINGLAKSGPPIGETIIS